ncbi:hypothetical protein FACS189429_2320 [Bacteroidia bacterium]|nr:hypothetical protein FACS189429_2320 [Bacteroidia bacterium]GHV44958.1 hypothetical protein FACS1894180_6940 [Bacteroidia bacterium]
MINNYLNYKDMYNTKDLINLTDKLWQNYKNIFEPQNRKRKHSLKEILKAVLYVDKTGCQWRMLPECFPKWQLVYYYFRKWKREGVFE